MKKHLILSTINAYTYKSVFKYVMSGIEKLGATILTGARWFNVPEDYVLKETDARIKDGQKQIRISGVRWLTNLNIPEKPGLCTDTTYDPNSFSFYNDYPAINVDSLYGIPYDYDNRMGVPITILDKMQNNMSIPINGNTYRIVGMMNNGTGNYDLAVPKVGDKIKYKRILIEKV